MRLRSGSQMLIIEADMVASGNLVILGSVRLEGRFEGTMICTRLDIGVDGYLHGKAFTEQLNLEGQVIGTVHARKAHLIVGSLLEGELVTEILRMDEAATLVGESRRNKAFEMPPEYLKLLTRTRLLEDDIANLETQHRVRLADEAVKERVQYHALRARFPARPAV